MSTTGRHKEREHDHVGVNRDRHRQQYLVAGTQPAFPECRDDAADFPLQYLERYALPPFSDARDQRGMWRRTLRSICK